MTQDDQTIKAPPHPNSLFLILLFFLSSLLSLPPLLLFHTTRLFIHVVCKKIILPDATSSRAHPERDWCNRISTILLIIWNGRFSQPEYPKIRDCLVWIKLASVAGWVILDLRAKLEIPRTTGLDAHLLSDKICFYYYHLKGIDYQT